MVLDCLQWWSHIGDGVTLVMASHWRWCHIGVYKTSANLCIKSPEPDVPPAAPPIMLAAISAKPGVFIRLVACEGHTALGETRTSHTKQARNLIDKCVDSETVVQLHMPCTQHSHSGLLAVHNTHTSCTSILPCIQYVLSASRRRAERKKKKKP